MKIYGLQRVITIKKSIPRIIMNFYVEVTATCPISGKICPKPLLMNVV